MPKTTVGLNEYLLALYFGQVLAVQADEDARQRLH